MHSLTTLLAAVLTLALTPALSAQTAPPVTLRITGAQAFRGVTHTAIGNMLSAGYTYGYQGSSLAAANAAIFTGTVGTTSVVIKTAWTGSTAGVRTVAQSIPVSFLADNTPQSTGGTSGAGAGSDSAIPDVAATDSDQDATIYTTPRLRDVPVGVAPYVFVANADAPASLDNITSQIAPVLFSNGTLPLSLFTGIAGDEAKLVYALGRDPDSGARLIAFVESGIGIFSSVVQYQAAITGAEVTAVSPWPAEPVGGVNYAKGVSGYGSFSTLSNVMTKTSFAKTGGYLISYMPVPDAQNAVNAGTGARILKYNGVPYSAANVANGAYTVWGYEHLMHRTTLDDAHTAVVNTLADQLITKDATVLLSTMNVRRERDGSVVLPK
jgi:hypothetical protein